MKATLVYGGRIAVGLWAAQGFPGRAARALGAAALGTMGAAVLDGCLQSSSLAPMSAGTTSIVVPFQLPGFMFAASPVTGKPFASQFPALGGKPPYRWSVSGGKLPAGYTFTAGGVLSGTTTDTSSYSFDITAADSQGATLSGTVSGPFAASGVIPFEMGTAALPSFGQDEDCGFEPLVTGGTPPYTFAATGLPPGVSFDPSTGTLLGRPTVSGTFGIVYTLTDALGNVASNSPMTVSANVDAPQPIGGSGSSSGSSGGCTSNGQCADPSICGTNPGAPDNGGVCGSDGACHCCFVTCSIDPQTGLMSACNCLGLGCGSTASTCDNQVGYTCTGATCATKAGMVP